MARRKGSWWWHGTGEAPPEIHKNMSGGPAYRGALTMQARPRRHDDFEALGRPESDPKASRWAPAGRQTLTVVRADSLENKTASNYYLTILEVTPLESR